MGSVHTIQPNTYRRQRRWSDQFIPAIKRIVGPCLLEESSFEVDTQQAADLVVVTAKNLTIAARIRRAKYYARYWNEFTIRSVNKGHKTELQKITDGWGDWMFYGFAASDDDDQSEIAHWRLLDLKVFRGCLIRETQKGRQRNNEDGTGFSFFQISSFPKDLIISSSDDMNIISAPIRCGSEKSSFAMAF